MTPEEEENQLQEAIKKLQCQIDEQRILVKKMISLKQKRLENERNKVLQLQSTVTQQKQLESRELDKSTNQYYLDKTKPQNIKEKINVVSSSSKISKPNDNKNVNHTKKIKIHPQHLIKQQIQQQQEMKQAITFSKRIMENRVKFHYKNRFFFSGYKFLLAFDETKLLLVSTQHEFTKKPITNADLLPLFITYKGKTYIKTPTGDYQIENLNQRINAKDKNKIKSQIPCLFYTKTGNCTKPKCLFQHIPDRVALCPTLQQNPKHKCLNKICHYSHKPSQFNSPSCKFFQKGECSNENCIFTHKIENEKSPICREFAYLGYCDEGLNCKFNHNFHCPDLKEYGRCMLGQKCLCLHNSNMIQAEQQKQVRNNDNDKVIQIVYDKNSDDNDDNSSDDSDDNVEFIVGPLGVGNDISSNLDYVRLSS